MEVFSIMFKWFFFILLGGLVITSIILFMQDLFNFSAFDEYISTFEISQRIIFAIIIILAGIFWSYAFYKYFKDVDKDVDKGKDVNEYEFSHYAGIISIPLFCIGLGGLAIFQNIYFIYIFCISGFLSLYCYSVNALKWFKSKTTSFELDVFMLFTLMGGVGIYFLNGHASIIINEEFFINASYFPFSKLVAILLIAFPFFSFFSFFSFIFVVFKRWNRKTDGKEDFYDCHLLILSYVVLLMSFSLDNNRSDILEMVATKYDFDSRSLCLLDSPEIEKSISGFIVLDPSHSKVLTYSEGRVPKYLVMPCITTKITTKKVEDE